MTPLYTILDEISAPGVSSATVTSTEISWKFPKARIFCGNLWRRASEYVHNY